MRRLRVRRASGGHAIALAVALAAAASFVLLAQGRIFHAIGCVGRAASDYTITDTRADPPIVYRIRYDEQELEFQVGHTVEVSGPLSADGIMTVQTLVWISNTCS